MDGRPDFESPPGAARDPLRPDRSRRWPWLILLLLAWLLWSARDLAERPDLSAYATRYLSGSEDPADVRVTFLGVSSLLISDGETSLLTDGFFSRPSIVETLFQPLQPDGEKIDRALARAGVRNLAAVMTVHSHYDHALDSPEVARRTGALLVGSESTAWIGRSAGLPESSLRVVRPGDSIEFGRFRVTWFEARHVPHGLAMGEITSALPSSARVFDYREGGSLSILVEHEKGSLLVHGSAGWVPGALQDRQADVVFLGVGYLGNMPESYRDEYWREVVEAVQARRVVPIHYDDFSVPFEDPVPLLPRWVDDVEASLRFLLLRGAGEGVDLRLLPAWQPVDPFAALPPRDRR